MAVQVPEIQSEPIRGDWWIDDAGQNLLKGVDGDENNPVLMPDDVIVAFLSQIPASKEAFLRQVPNMLPDEQERLYRLANCTPSYFFEDYNTESDKFMARVNNTPMPYMGQKKW